VSPNHFSFGYDFNHEKQEVKLYRQGKQLLADGIQG
jgi:hypothetical protein